MVLMPVNTSQNPAIQKAMESVAAAIPQAEADPTRPVYHFRPPANWMNDPNGTIYHNGIYHLFYQHNPYGDEWGHMHWGHSRSTDLVHWEHLPIALWPSLELGEEHCFSGCAGVSSDGQPMLFYTEVGLGKDEQWPPNEQWAAIGSPDWLTWQKHPSNPILSLETHGGPPFERDWRDPFIFHEAGRTFMVLGGAFDETAGIALYETDDPQLVKWTYRGLLYEKPRSELRFFECPNFFKVQDQWVLLHSPYRPIEYAVGSFDIETLKFTPAQEGILDAGFTDVPNFYASNILYDAQERCILLGWARGFRSGNGWNGCLALPRILTIGSDGHPRQQPVPELEILRGAHVIHTDQTIDSSIQQFEGVSGHTIEIHAAFRAGDTSEFGLQLRRSENGLRFVPILYADGQLNVDGTSIPCELMNDSRLKLQIFLDRSLLEVFVNDGETCVTKVLDAPIDDIGIAVLANEGAVQLDRLDCWQMNEIW